MKSITIELATRTINGELQQIINKQQNIILWNFHLKHLVPPFKVYISNTNIGKIVGHFICDDIKQLDCDYNNLFYWKGNTPVNISEIGWKYPFDYKKIISYTKGYRPYGWHISNLNIYNNKEIK